jgi:predicted ArsR family transcriptional regulator
MALDNDRNRVLASLRGRAEGADCAALAGDLELAKEVVERHLRYCADYALVAWTRYRNGAGRAMITTRGCDYLVRQGL